MYQDKILSMIGLAKRAGKVCAGAPLCEKEIKAKRSELIIIAKDISDVCVYMTYIQFENNI